jgi:hypothetical protein
MQGGEPQESSAKAEATAPLCVPCVTLIFQGLSHLAARNEANQMVEIRMRVSYLNLCNSIWRTRGGTPAIPVF